MRVLTCEETDRCETVGSLIIPWSLVWPVNRHRSAIVLAFPDRLLHVAGLGVIYQGAGRRTQEPGAFGLAEVHLRLFGLELSPYVLSSAAMLCFLVSFYSRYLGFGLTFSRIGSIPVQFWALAAVVWAYRRIGGLGYLLWLAPVVVELLFWPRVALQIFLGISLWYPFWYETAYLYFAAFLFGLYLNRRRYAIHLLSSRARVPES